jgi:hypothetical protein
MPMARSDAAQARWKSSRLGHSRWIFALSTEIIKEASIKAQ